MRFADLGPRLASAIAMLVVASSALWLGGAIFTLLAALIAGIMMWEVKGVVVGPHDGLGQSLLLAAGGSALAVLLAGFVGPVQAMLVALAAISMIGITDPRNALWLGGGLIWVTGAAGFLVIMRLREPDLAAFLTVLWLVVVVIASDVGGYFAGRLIGGRKLWPRVSPGKTWSGAFGSLAAGVIAGGVVVALVGKPLLAGLVWSAGFSIAAQAGDLLESAVKRNFGVKDSSSLIPGHGGLLDRLDGLLGATWFVGGYESVIEIIDYLRRSA